MGTSSVLTVPAQIMREWERREVHHVLITLEAGALRVQPLTARELLDYPAPEEEEPLRGPAR